MTIKKFFNKIGRWISKQLGLNTKPATPVTGNKYKLVKVWDTPKDHPNTISMLAIPGVNKALACLARIGFGSGYQSSLYEIDKNGRTKHVATTDNETLGHCPFVGADKETIYLPHEHGSQRVGKYRGGTLSWGAKTYGRWCLSGLVQHGRNVVVSSNSYNGMFNDQPVFNDADTGEQLVVMSKTGLGWWSYIHSGKTCMINCYGESLLYRDNKAESTNAKIGTSFNGAEVLGGGNRSGKGEADGRIWVNGKEFRTECQSFEHITTENGRCLLFGVNPDSVYEIIDNQPVLLAQITGDRKWTGGWAFGSCGCVLNDGTILFGRTSDNGGAIYRLDLEQEVTPPTPSTTDDKIKIVELWGGMGFNDNVDSRYQLTVSDDGRNWSAMPDDWPPGLHGPAVCFAFYERNPGEWVGGKYDWLPKPPRTRDYSNIRNGYNGWKAPAAGTKMKACAVSVDGRRSNFVTITYK